MYVETKQTSAQRQGIVTHGCNAVGRGPLGSCDRARRDPVAHDTAHLGDPSQGLPWHIHAFAAKAGRREQGRAAGLLLCKSRADRMDCKLWRDHYFTTIFYLEMGLEGPLKKMHVLHVMNKCNEGNGP